MNDFCRFLTRVFLWETESTRGFFFGGERVGEDTMVLFGEGYQQHQHNRQQKQEENE